MDTTPEAVSDRIAWMAAHHFQAPMAMVNFIDEGRQWFKAAYGLDIRETSRDVAFCHHTSFKKF
ncbi:MAG TPA: hypothetical protein VEB64_08930 [Azospirillaceae bacterium]|nr:hypothetical protein [Azospirillaceae bacterium]